MFELFTDLPLGVLKPTPERPEMRRTERKPVDDRVWIRAYDAAARALLLDISAEGALLETDLELNAGMAIHLRCFFDDGERPLGVWAKTVRADPAPQGRLRVGVRFSYMRQSDKRRLQRYLTQRKLERSWRDQFGL